MVKKSRPSIKSSSLKWLIAIVVLGALVRIPVMKWGLPNTEHFNPYYPDEYYPLQLFKNMKPKQWDFNPRDFRNPTFFYYHIAAALKGAELLGLVKISEDKSFYLETPREWAKIYLVGRATVFVYSLLCIFLIFFLVNELYGSGPGLIASFLFSVTPLAIYSSTVQEISTPLCFWTGFLLFSSIKAINNKSAKWFLISAVSYGLAMSTKYLAAPFAMVLVYTHYFVFKKIITPKIFIAGLLSIVGFIFGSPYVLVEIGQFLGEFIDVFTGSGLSNSRTWNFGPAHMGYTFGWQVFITSLIGLALGLWKKEHAAFLLGGSAFLLLFLYSRATVIVSRYYILPIFFLLPFAAKIIYDLWMKVQKGKPVQKFWMALILVMIIGPTFFHSIGIVNSLSRYPDPRDVSSHWIRENIPEGQTIGVIREPYYYSPGIFYMDYFHEARYQMKERTMKPYGFDIGDVKQEKIWGESWPETVVTTNIEYKLLGLGEEKQDQLHKHLSKYYNVEKQWERHPKFYGFKYPMKSRYALEWMMPYPSITVWKKKDTVDNAV